MRALGLTIGTQDLSVAELSAAVLDGDLLPVDEYFTAADLPVGHLQRAIAVGSLVSFRLIAERMTAAWIYGLLQHPPTRHELCVPASRRANSPPSARIIVREVVIDDDDLRHIAGLAVTTPLRTIVDIARNCARFTTLEHTVIGKLMTYGTVTMAQCEARLNATPHLPNKRRALERIRMVGGSLCRTNRHPSVTRYTS